MTAFDPLEMPLRGVSLIEASAGTGKTTTITQLVLRLLLEPDDAIGIGEILVVTYTRAATAELCDRIRRALVQVAHALEHGGPPLDPALVDLVERRRAAGTSDRDRARLARALYDFDRAAIYTIHGFCQRTLVERAFESSAPFDVELVADVAPLLADVVHDYWTRTACETPVHVVQALPRSGAVLTALMRVAILAVRHPRMPVLPEAPAAPAPDDVRLSGLVENAASLWRRERDELVDCLCNAKSLNRNTYRRATIERDWIPALDAFAEPGRIVVPEFLPRLTPGALEQGTKPGHRAPSHPYFDACGAIVATRAAVQMDLKSALLALQHGVVGYARRELARRKEELGAKGFDDLLYALADALAGAGGPALAAQIGQGTKAALIDEFQDTDPVQYAIFRRLQEATGIPLVLIGDPKQAIYGFRGADVFAYLSASTRAKPRHSLTVNHRSDPRLVAAVHAVFSNVERPFLFEKIELDAVKPAPGARERLSGDGAPGESLTLLFARRDADEKPIPKDTAYESVSRATAAEIARLLDAKIRIDDEDIRPRHVAVLCRTNEQARLVQRELRALHVPSVVDGDNSVFDAKMAGELAIVLEAVAQPSDMRRVRAALATAFFPVDAAALHRMEETEDELDRWLEDFTRWSGAWHERGFVQSVHMLLDEAKARAELLSYPDGERRLTDVLHLVEILHGVATQQHLGPMSLLRWFAEMRVDPQARREIEAETAQIRLEHDEHAVRLTTVHRSKGLEYPIVFCPFLWGGAWTKPPVLFHDRADAATLKLDLAAGKDDPHGQAAIEEAVAEDLRLCYVALTRARHRCYVVWGRFSGSETSAPARLLHGRSERAFDEKTDAELRVDLEDLCRRSGGTIAVRDLDLDRGPRYRPREPLPEAVEVREAKRRVPRLPRMSSFTQLVRHADATLDAEEGVDRDEQAAASEAVVGPGAAEASQTPILLADFPAGPRAGLALHAIFEHVDFRREVPEELGREVRDRLGRFGFDVARWAEPVERAFAAVLDTPLGADGLRLAGVSRADRVDELEFMLPVARQGAALDPVRLAEVLERHRAPAACRDYHERVARLGFPELRGHLKGFVDLVFRHDGRYYVVDYKSNRLGSVVGDYGAAHLAEAMAEHHYPLQYLLYVTALHRHLALRLPGYDYDACFGGVYYLFVRGMAPDHPLGTGVYADRPSRALVEDLAALIAGSEVRA